MRFLLTLFFTSLTLGQAFAASEVARMFDKSSNDFPVVVSMIKQKISQATDEVSFAHPNLLKNFSHFCDDQDFSDEVYMQKISDSETRIAFICATDQADPTTSNDNSSLFIGITLNNGQIVSADEVSIARHERGDFSKLQFRPQVKSSPIANVVTVVISALVAGEIARATFSSNGDAYGNRDKVSHARVLGGFSGFVAIAARMAFNISEEEALSYGALASRSAGMTREARTYAMYPKNKAIHRDSVKDMMANELGIYMVQLGSRYLNFSFDELTLKIQKAPAK